MSSERTWHYFPPQTPPLIEAVDGFEENLLEFFAGRTLISQRAPDDEQRVTHDEKYAKEVEYDAKDTAKGKPVYKKYRQDRINCRTQCDAQYINNLHTYYGNGSKLKPTPKHYAVDLVCGNSVDTDATAKLKNLEVLRNSKSVSDWVKDHRKTGDMYTMRRRCFSCPDLEFYIDPPTNITNPSNRWHKDPFAGLYNLDTDYKLPLTDSHYLRKDVSNTANYLISRVNAFNHNAGFLEIQRVLFSTEKMCAYVIPARFDLQLYLREFSEYFMKWFNRLSPAMQNTFGTDLEEKKKFPNSRQPTKSYWWKVNVILCLDEFQHEGTQFRRARHVCDVRWSVPPKDVFMEIDTGELRIVETSPLTVRRMPHEFAHFFTPILECRFEGAKTQDEVTARIEEIRRTGRAYVGRFDRGDRVERQNAHYEGMNRRAWCDIETAVVRK
ncbi:hypothetical protein CRE_25923 [Caenorhabditis remanei]|uniref:Uncharacterized protein n=1 Tax=Caenorhabditis remanei TaxID=31234 RepID=E3NJA5_CAERE|nr:hypothetical protein CRE_25923 [Caenorhabditis remanei]